ncbi:thiamine phosphate synthase [Bovifimicola ammoniilytica]|uniref:thiamine phosphate synthase n=1 Tax=Bovifimicola ammoniilytica TaxID=2981720 RepID=UPI00082243B6|nr:thiamine phosphate synthase [Bovifimicola ammoniilytica]MCU6754408.1 thiamine phosphate synthase [Bovifimicola ammoniilytica]SCJ85130.1 Regulatory protein tenI [uncultured Eubacterium sp.]
MSDTMNNIIAITNRKLCRNRSFDEAIDTALEDNVRYIIIREKDLSIQEYIKFVNDIQLHIHNIFPDTQTKIIMNLGNVQNTFELFEIINNTGCRNVHMPVYTLDKLETSDFGNRNSSFNSIRNDIADKNINNIYTGVSNTEINNIINYIQKEIEIFGISIHSINDIEKTCRFKPDYYIAGHIFNTECKKGKVPRGLDFIENICKSTDIPVYGVGGINKDNMKEVINAGASGVCMMSEYFH